ncbi:MAG: tRNA (adenosine(37)-N6)-dimethylallyltransferase MiaA [Clostridia bacterium]|nr:MAG: tRNA (adenosine(37)-N6)-dimethylallyltransferase MiaA [Clostridia bacterium]
MAAIVGPTATGKSRVAVEVADHLDAEIVSADAFQVYRGLDIGTAKVAEEEKVAASGRYIRHHLMDIIEPDADFSVAAYQQAALAAFADIRSRGRLPLLVGGSGLYVNAALGRYCFPPQTRDDRVRRELLAEAEARGLAHLYRELAQADPVAAAKIHPHDQKRIIRGLEVYRLTSRPPSSFWGRPEAQPAGPGSSGARQSTCSQTELPVRVAMVGLTWPRPRLYAAIEARVEDMLARGLVAEVQGLLAKGYPVEANAFQALGYKQVTGFLQGRYDFREMVRLIKRDTRRYAKRQLTWFRRDGRVQWLDVSRFDSQAELAAEITAIVSRTLAGNVE